MTLAGQEADENSHSELHSDTSLHSRSPESQRTKIKHFCDGFKPVIYLTPATHSAASNKPYQLENQILSS